jgi:hypothetical protein
MDKFVVKMATPAQAAASFQVVKPQLCKDQELLEESHSKSKEVTTLVVGPNNSKSGYINTRCQLMVGKTSDEAIGTLFFNSKGIQKPYTKADLAYDLNHGSLMSAVGADRSYKTPNSGGGKTKSRTSSFLSPPEDEHKSKRLKPSAKSAMPKKKAPLKRKPISKQKQPPKKKPAKTSTEWLVIKEEAPSSCGANRGMSAASRKKMTNTVTVSSHKSKSEAIAAAIESRDRECSFEGWAEEFYAKNEPPFFSGDGENYDDDEWVTIYLRSPAAQDEAAKKAAKAEQRALSIPKKKPFTIAFGEVDKSFAPTKDNGIFFRNPSPIDGAQIMPMKSYPASFLENVKRDSDKNYLMRSFCLDGSSVSGAKFTTAKKSHVICRTMTWITPTDLDDFADDDSIVDCAHPGLFQKGNQSFNILLSAESLLKSTSPATRCLFLDCFAATGGGFRCQGFTATAVASAIAATEGQLQCFSMSESCISKGDLDALAKCTNLRGFDVSQVSQRLFIAIDRCSQ